MPNSRQSITSNLSESQLLDQYLKLLSRTFPTQVSATTEIINLEAILNLPKGTEHFMSDLHGEADAFDHVLRNASGAIKRKVTEILGQTLRQNQIDELSMLIYYPIKKLEQIKKAETTISDDWYRVTLNLLVKVCETVASKYTRSKVRKALPKEFSYIIQELLHESSAVAKKTEYVNQIVSTIVETGSAESFITAMCNLIQRLVVDKLHIVGDVFDRGPGAHIIMDRLAKYHDVDIQWGNHDILWMGAASGNTSCMAGVIRVSLKYGNLQTLEQGYGINLLPLATFAMHTYTEEQSYSLFRPNTKFTDRPFDDNTIRLLSQMHKAISVIQFKLEGQLISRHPEYEMEDRRLLHLIDYEKGTINLPYADGSSEVKLLDNHFPTINPSDPYALSSEESELLSLIETSFRASKRLRSHMYCLFRKGGTYATCNGKLMFHASVPMTEDRKFRNVCIGGEMYAGRELLDRIDRVVRMAFFKNKGKDAYTETNPQFGLSEAIDYCWYLWCGKDSPFFDKDRMTTFERYFIADKAFHKEEKGQYFILREDPDICDYILDSFGVKGDHRYIINGHVPVRSSKGENPLKAGGKLIVIDGGFSKAYHRQTGIAGYTLVYHSRGLQLVQHEPFVSADQAIREGLDIKSSTLLVEKSSERWTVRDTDQGKELQAQIEGLKMLLHAYYTGKL